MDLLEPYRTERADRILIQGADFPINAQATTPLALIFHQLATNAAKYGALSLDAGSVVIDVVPTDGTCTCVWRERNGPPVGEPPKSEGFG